MINEEFEELSFDRKLNDVSCELLIKSDNLRNLFSWFLNEKNCTEMFDVHVCMLELIADNLRTQSQRLENMASDYRRVTNSGFEEQLPG